ncbi:MAG TPA: cytochrome-c oxidase, cbb3-type subunit III [Xanthobacteraceae bacterium]|nr:cytochrome-c oxidase, cbb3-type subunit III [Xanthobacteraceae bacterium]
MAMSERDPLTGHATTGHEWNGIKELNAPVPRAVWFFLIITVVFSVIWWVLMPTWPLGTTYTKGILGVDQRNTVAQKLKTADEARSPWTKRIDEMKFAEVAGDAELMKKVRQTGRTLFGDNCAACHGFSAKGGPGFPNLTTASSLWGSDPEKLFETIRVGINAAHPETRTAQMPAFGRDQMLPRADIEKVVDFVETLSNPAAAKQVTPDALEAGKELFVANCAACHGDNGKGNVEVGAPDLTDASWIYGGDKQSILNTVWGGRQGHMPAWEHRLSNIDRKILALYLSDLRKPGQ